MPPVTKEKNIPQLVIPPPAVARHPDTITSAKVLQAWLAELPLADPAHLVDQLYKQLKLIVRDPTPNNKYAELIKALQPTLNHIQMLVWRNIRQAGKHKMSAQLRSTISQLLLEFACAHMRLINQSIIASTAPQASDLYHAILPMARLTQWDVLQYRLTRPTIWRKILHIFAIAEHYKTAGNIIDSQFKLDYDPDDTHGAFFGLLALLLSDPYRLNGDQQHILIKGLGQFSDHLRTNHEDQSKSQIPLDLTGMLPPLSLVRKQLESKKLRYLQLDEFFLQIEQHHFENDPGNTISQWLLNSLRSLANFKTAKEGRINHRQTQIANGHFIQGLSQIHSHLQELQTGMRQHKTKQNGSGIYLESDNEELNAVLGIPCRQVEESATGCSFIMHDKQHLPQLSDWLLLETTTVKSSKKSLVQIRRRLQREDNSDEIGVEKVNGSVIPVNLSNGNIGLLNIDEVFDKHQLITQAGNFQAGKQHTLYAHDRNYTVQLQELLEGGQSERIKVRLLKD